MNPIKTRKMTRILRTSSPQVMRQLSVKSDPGIRRITRRRIKRLEDRRLWRDLVAEHIDVETSEQRVADPIEFASCGADGELVVR